MLKTVLICLPLPALACPTVDDLNSGGIRVTWQDETTGTYQRNFRGELIFLPEAEGEQVSGVIGPDGLDRSVSGSVDDLASATFFFVYSFDLPNVLPQPNSGQKGIRGAFVEGAVAGSSAFAWETGELTQTDIGDCSYASMPFTMIYGEGADEIIETHVWLPDLGIRLLVSTDDGFVLQTNPPIQISVRH